MSIFCRSGGGNFVIFRRDPEKLKICHFFVFPETSKFVKKVKKSENFAFSKVVKKKGHLVGRADLEILRF